MIELRDPPFDDVGERSALGLGAGGEVAHQFRVEVPGLPAGPVQPAFQRDVRLRHDELALECHRAGQVQEEALARAVPSDDESNARSPLLDPLEIVQDGGHLVATPDLKVTHPDARNDARPATIAGSRPVPAALWNCS